MHFETIPIPGWPDVLNAEVSSQMKGHPIRLKCITPFCIYLEQFHG